MRTPLCVCDCSERARAYMCACVAHVLLFLCVCCVCVLCSLLQPVLQSILYVYAHFLSSFSFFFLLKSIFHILRIYICFFSFGQLVMPHIHTHTHRVKYVHILSIALTDTFTCVCLCVCVQKTETMRRACCVGKGK